MNFEDEAKQVDDEIKGAYSDLVVNLYRPLFTVVLDKAHKYMVESGLDKIDVTPYHIGSNANLVYSKEGHFIHGKRGRVELKDLPKIFQEYSDYIAGCADSRGHSTPNVQTAMRSALNQVRESVRKCLSDQI